MVLEFPNLSRNYDSTLQRIRFPGYDGVFEISFFIEIEVLSVVVLRNVSTESECLLAFDRARNAIQKAARKAYRHGRYAVYVLTPSDFR